MPKKILGITMYDIKEVADILGVTTRTIQTYLKDERIQAQKIARKWYFSEDNIKAFIKGYDPANKKA